MPAKGIHAHPLLKLGKSTAQSDRRNLQLAAILKAAPPLPKEYDFDLKHPEIPLPMFANDRFGDCVIAGRAHQTLRFEDVEQRKVLAISDDDVTREYFAETGGQDTGLVVLESLKAWRRRGWLAAKRRYKIRAFAQVNQANRTEVKQSIFLDLGVGFGLSLPKSAQAQTQAGKPWDVVKGPGSAPGSWGGHYVYVSGYTQAGPVCVTWGRKQQMTWAFVGKYCDEAYAIIDAVNTPKKARGLNVRALDEFLAGLG